MEEIWKDIEGFEGLYQVSNLGNVKSLPRNTTKGKLLKPAKTRNGYLQVVLSKNGEAKRFYIHRLVAEAFLPNEDELPEVDHINSDKTDNRVANLQWISRVENLRKKETGMMIPKRVICLETGKIFETVADAANYVNRTPRTMLYHLSGKHKTCAGKHFKYYNKDVISSDANTILFGIRPKDLKGE